MRVLITSSGPSMDSVMDERFGRAPYFIICDADTGSFEAIDNPYMSGHGGAGVSVAKLCIDKDVRAVVSGSFGPNAQEILKTAGIDMYVSNGGLKVEEVLEKFKNGELKRF